MDAVVDVSNKDGKMLADAPRTTALSQTQVYSQLDQGADAEVKRIIAANLGRSADGALAQKSAPAVRNGGGRLPATHANPS
jgi:membrane fusion protein (multidrug efflux system)